MREQNKQIVENIGDKLKAARLAVFTCYRGLNVNNLNLLRKQLRSNNIEYKVYKNTLISIAAKNAGLEDISSFLNGPTAIAFAMSDEITACKALAAFAKDHENLKVQVGLLGGKILDAESIKAISKIPSKDILLARIVTSLGSCIGSLLFILNGQFAGLLNVLNAKIKKDQGGKENG